MPATTRSASWSGCPTPPPDDRHVPDMAFAFYDQMVVFDHVSKMIVVVAMAAAGSARRHARRRPTTTPGGASTAWSSSLPPAGASCSLRDIDTGGDVKLAYTSNFTQPQFEEAVRKCVEYIRAGDIFQVVLSQRLEVPLVAHPFEIYRTLRVVNPSPFMFYLRTPSVTLVGASPEIMVRVVDGQVTVRPLAGTRRRGATEEEDRRLAEELLADPKERAEHVMLVDLGRNDVGRVCRYRSVRVERRDDHRALQPRDAHHLERHRPAGRRARRPSTPCRPVCPPAPSPAPRRSAPWRSSTSWSRIAAGRMPGPSATSISTATWTPASPCGRWSCRATGPTCRPAPGIVADSVPANEWQETLNKARGLLKAIELAQPPRGRKRAAGFIPADCRAAAYRRPTAGINPAARLRRCPIENPQHGQIFVQIRPCNPVPLQMISMWLNCSGVAYRRRRFFDAGKRISRPSLSRTQTCPFFTNASVGSLEFPDGMIHSNCPYRFPVFDSNIISRVSFARGVSWRTAAY